MVSVTVSKEAIQQCAGIFHFVLIHLAVNVESNGWAGMPDDFCNHFRLGAALKCQTIDSGTTWRREVNLGGAARLATLHFDS